MRSYKDAKAMAKSLRDVLAARNVSLSHSESLEIVAQQFGYADWNTLASKLHNEERPAAPSASADARVQAMLAMPSGTAEPMAAVPVVPLRDVVVYPSVLIPLFAGRPKTIRAAEMAMRGDRRVLLVTQREPQVDDPSAEHLYQVGTLANVRDVVNTPGAPVKILVEGAARARLDELHAEEHLSAHFSLLSEIQAQNGQLDTLKKSVLKRFEQHARLSGWPLRASQAQTPSSALEDILSQFSRLDAGRFADTMAAHLPLPLAQKQAVLEILDTHKRLEYVEAASKELDDARPAPQG
jgi:ATP-dependent Lon protease